ncbi:MAG: hypothetical protein ABIK28_25670 [Planctomycetota bacterium]
MDDDQIGREAASVARSEVLKMAREKGVTLSHAMTRLKDALDAKEEKFFQKDGIVTDQKDVIAHGIRLKATELALALHDAMPSQRHEHEISGQIGATVSLSDEDRKLLKAALNDVAKELVNKAHEHD